MPDKEKKQSTVVTYLDPGEKGRPVTMHGVSLVPGKSVDLADFMPREKAEKAAASLAGNRYFEVQGEDKGEQFDADEAERLRAENNAEANQLVQDAEEANRERMQKAQEQYVAPGTAKLETAPARKGAKSGAVGNAAK